MYKIIRLVLVLQVMVFSVYYFLVHKGQRLEAANWPSTQLARIAQRYWHATGHKSKDDIKFVGGQERIVYYLGAYLPSKPLMFRQLSFLKSPWINKKDFYQHGAMFITQGCDNSTLRYAAMGFNVKTSKCFAADQTNKFYSAKVWFRLYIIGPKVAIAK